MFYVSDSYMVSKHMALSKPAICLATIVSGTFIIWLFFNSLSATDNKYLSLTKKRYGRIVNGRPWLSYIFSKKKDKAMPKYTLSQPPPLERITMLSWNIWFVRFAMKTRMNGISEIIEELRPNIITLNEVTQANLKLLASQPWYRSYRVLPTDIKRQEAYFVVMLTNLPVQSWKAYPFYSFDLGWKLLVSTLHFPVKTISGKEQNLVNISFTIATSHFESLSANTLIRERQLNKSLNILLNYENTCLMGDLNLEQKVDGEIMLPKHWEDAWLSLPGNSHRNGFTYDPSINKMIPQGEYTKDRYDRVFCKLTNFSVKKMKLVGKKSIVPGVFPSDHFGVFTVLLPQTIPHRNTKTVNAYEKNIVFFKRPAGWKKFLKS